MRFTSEQRLDDGVLEREFTLGEIPGVLWTTGSAPAPLILSGHNGGLHKRLPRLVARARHYAAEYGFAVAAIDAPGHGDRPRSAVDEQARAGLRRAMEAGGPVDEIVDAFIVPLVERAGGPGMADHPGRPPFAARDRRPGRVRGDDRHRHSAGAGRASHLGRCFFGGGFVPGTLFEAAWQVTIPLQFLLQWDDEGMERPPVLDLFDAFGATEKTLHANLGGHAGVPWFEVDDAARFFARHVS